MLIHLDPGVFNSLNLDFLSLEDAVSCLMIGLEKPPESGEYRVYNQFDQHYSVNELANIVKRPVSVISGILVP